MIKFEINRQIVKITHCDTVVADSIDYIEAEVVFSSDDWQSMDRIYLHFCDGENDYPIDVTDGKIEKSNHLCLTAGRWDVWAHGNRFDNGTVAERITTNVIGIKVKPSGAIEGQIMPMPASIAEQLDARVTYLEEHGGGGGTVDDVKVDGVSVVSSGIANIDLSGKANASDVYTKQEVNTRLQAKANITTVNEQLAKKQDKLTAGSNITIEDNVISASGGTVDQTYNPISTNAQSGKAVAEAVLPINIKADKAVNDANMAIDMLGNVPEDTDVQTEIDDLDERVTTLEQGGGGGTVDDVKVDGVSVVSSGIANIDLSGKVDKMDGKGLSTNDYTNEEKSKLASLHNYDDTELQAQINALNTAVSFKENTSNKTTTISDLSTNEQYPSAKAVYDLFNSIVNGNEVSY